MNCQGRKNENVADALAHLSLRGTISTGVSPWEATVLPLNYARVCLMLAAGLERV